MHDSSTLPTQSDASSRQPRAHNTKGSRITKDAFTVPKYTTNAFSVPKYKTVQNVADPGSQDEEFDFSGVDLTHTGISSPSRKGKEKEKGTTPEAGGRSAKRRKVAHDFGFLETSLPHTVQATTSSSPSESAFAVPSSDLLKYIHHFACNYYSDRGQLFNESRTWRKGRKARRLARLAAKAKLLDEDANSDEEEGPVPEVDADPLKTVTPHRRDMYKTMDGSALLAIGMLLQEHIARILAPKIPDGWEQGISDESDEEVESRVGEEDLDEDGEEDLDEDGEEDLDEDGDEETEDKRAEDSGNDERSDGDVEEDGEDGGGGDDQMGSENDDDVEHSDEDETD